MFTDLHFPKVGRSTHDMQDLVHASTSAATLVVKHQLVMIGHGAVTSLAHMGRVHTTPIFSPVLFQAIRVKSELGICHT